MTPGSRSSTELQAIVNDPEALARLAERFWAKVEPEPMSGCLLWLGSKSKGGYGNMNIAPRTNDGAHRISWVLHHGTLPNVIDHLCRNPSCVNPAHMRDVDTRTNVLAGVSRVASFANQTTCYRGHPFDEKNTLYWPCEQDGREKWKRKTRRCRECLRLYLPIRRAVAAAKAARERGLL